MYALFMNRTLSHSIIIIIIYLPTNNSCSLYTSIRFLLFRILTHFPSSSFKIMFDVLYFNFLPHFYMFPLKILKLDLIIIMATTTTSTIMNIASTIATTGIVIIIIIVILIFIRLSYLFTQFDPQNVDNRHFIVAIKSTMTRKYNDNKLRRIKFNYVITNLATTDTTTSLITFVISNPKP